MYQAHSTVDLMFDKTYTHVMFALGDKQVTRKVVWFWSKTLKYASCSFNFHGVMFSCDLTGEDYDKFENAFFSPSSFIKEEQ